MGRIEGSNRLAQRFVQFVRELIAKLLESPDKIDWKATQVSIEQEKKWTDEYRGLFAQHGFFQ